MANVVIPEQIKQFESIVALSMKSFGLKSVESKIYASVYCSIDCVSLEDIASKTGYSLATISTVANYLVNLNVLLRIKKPGTKKVFLNTHHHVSEILTSKLTAALEFIVQPKKSSLPKLIEDLKNDLKTEKSSVKRKEGKRYLKLLQNDLKETLFIESIHTHMIQFIRKKSKEL